MQVGRMDGVNEAAREKEIMRRDGQNATSSIPKMESSARRLQSPTVILDAVFGDCAPIYSSLLMISFSLAASLPHCCFSVTVAVSFG